MGTGATGAKTAAMRAAFLATVRAETVDTRGWLTPLLGEAAAVAAPAASAVSAT